MNTFFPLKRSMTPGDMVAVLTSSTSRADAEHYLKHNPNPRIRTNAPAMTLRTFESGPGLTTTVVRVGRF